MSETTQLTPLTIIPVNADRIMSSSGSTIQLYGGSIPFSWTLEVYLEKETLESEEVWSVTLHITSQGTQQQVFRSSTVEIIPNLVTIVPFPVPGGSTSHTIQPGEYGIASCTGMFTDEMSIAPQSIGVQLIVPIEPNALPSLNIVNTTMATSWLIGARHIVLTDPPLRSVLVALPPASVVSSGTLV